MARYRKVDPRIWNDQKFRLLKDDGKLAFLFLLTHPQLTSLGAMRGTINGLAAELGWTERRMRDAISDAISHGMVHTNPEASFIGLPKFLRYNEPEGPNSVTKAWIDALDLIPECPEKTQTIIRCRKYLDGKSDAFRHAIGDAIWDAFAMPCPIQEQEQEQEQEEDHARFARVNARANGSTALTDTSLHEAELQSAYPEFSGRQDWLTALHHARRLIDEQRATWTELIEGVQRYAAYVAAGGVSGPRYVMTPAKFFNGDDKPWSQAWTPPPTKAEQRTQSNVAAFDQVRQEILGGKP